MFKIISGAALVMLALLAVNVQRLAPRSAPVVLPVTFLPAEGLVWGAYDPAQRMAGDGRLGIEQVYMPWNRERTPELTAAVRAIRARHRVPLVVIEPWPFVWEGLTTKTLFADILAGRYDAPIRDTCSALGREAPQLVLVRWGHEMDLNGRFPWSNDDPEGFAAAYRHFVDICRATGATNLAYVWSPGGDPDLQAFWPGAEYVDYVGMTGLGFGDWDVWRGAERPHTFREIFAPRYELVERYGKPVLLCEFASTGPAAHQEAWLAEAAAAFGEYPLLKAVVYFNAVDPVAWGDAGVPDWRVRPGVFPPAGQPSRAAKPAESVQPAA